MLNKPKLVTPCLNLVAGLLWLFVAFLKFDNSRGADVVLPCAARSLFLIGAAFGFKSWMRRHDGEAQPAITTLSGTKPL